MNDILINIMITTLVVFLTSLIYGLHQGWECRADTSVPFRIITRTNTIIFLGALMGLIWS